MSNDHITKKWSSIKNQRLRSKYRNELLISKTKMAVIVPAYNAEATIHACLNGIRASTRIPDEIIVYNDGSTDGTALIAEQYGATVINGVKRASGPAIGRNIAAQSTDADILVFIDADVEVHRESIARLETALESEPGVVAAFGSYDDSPLSRRTAALYANLRHHFYHQRSERNATTFWSGFGIIRRRQFLAVGGFDARYSKPSIEDIELGTRIRRDKGKIILASEAQAKHCKDWALRQLWTTDIFSRAIPWSRLIVSGKTNGADLNTSIRERVISVLAHLIWITGISSIIDTRAAPVFLTSIFLFAIFNSQFFLFLYRKGGLFFLLKSAALHWCYYIYSSMAFAYVAFSYELFEKKRAVKRAVR